MGVYDAADFNARVRFAARHIASGRATTRHFDSCFEMQDGDAVALALLRRVRTRPDTKLAANIWRYLSRSTVLHAEARHGDAPDLVALATRLRSEAQAAFEELMARQQGSDARGGRRG